MSKDAVESLIDRWVNEPHFRTELRDDPEGAVHRSGIELTGEEWAALRSVDWGLSDEQLEKRINYSIPII